MKPEDHVAWVVRLARNTLEAPKESLRIQQLGVGQKYRVPKKNGLVKGKIDQNRHLWSPLGFSFWPIASCLFFSCSFPRSVSLRGSCCVWHWCWAERFEKVGGWTANGWCFDWVVWAGFAWDGGKYVFLVLHSGDVCFFLAVLKGFLVLFVLCCISGSNKHNMKTTTQKIQRCIMCYIFSPHLFSPWLAAPVHRGYVVSLLGVYAAPEAILQRGVQREIREGKRYNRSRAGVTVRNTGIGFEDLLCYRSETHEFWGVLLVGSKRFRLEKRECMRREVLNSGNKPPGLRLFHLKRAPTGKPT